MAFEPSASCCSLKPGEQGGACQGLPGAGGFDLGGSAATSLYSVELNAVWAPSLGNLMGWVPCRGPTLIEESLESFPESLESFLVQPGPQKYRSAWLEPRLPLTEARSLRSPRAGGLRNEVRGSLGTLGVLHSAWHSEVSACAQSLDCHRLRPGAGVVLLPAEFGIESTAARDAWPSDLRAAV